VDPLRRPSPDAMPAHHPLDPLAADGLSFGAPYRPRWRAWTRWISPSSARSAVLRGLCDRDRHAQQPDRDTLGAAHMTRIGQTPR